MKSVSAMTRTFITERPLADGKSTGKVDVDDAFVAAVEFHKGAIGTLKASRFAAGRKNYQVLEISGMSAEVVRACAAAGAVAGKYYPAGSTTNASDGLLDPSDAEDALAAMEDAGLILCVHAEEPSAPVLDREEAFIPVLERILSAHPQLKMVVEHVSSAALLSFVFAAPARVAATVTAHHLLFTLDDLLGEGMDPNLYCKPVLKSARDRDALRDAVLRGESRLFFGSDSAPHPRAAKESPRAAAPPSTACRRPRAD
jgi:dihydroorotase